MVKNKAPAFQFYPADWKRDTELQMCSVATKGIWIQLLCSMFWAKERGKIRGTAEQICRLVGCDDTELSNFLHEYRALRFCNVTKRNGKITIINRRMHDNYLERKANAERQLRFRQKKRNVDSNAKVTPYSSSSTSSSTSLKDIYKEKGVTPTLQEVLDAAIILGISNQKAKEFYEHYQPQGWLYGNGLPITDLRGGLIRWKNNEYKFGKGETVSEQYERMKSQGKL